MHAQDDPPRPASSAGDHQTFRLDPERLAVGRGISRTKLKCAKCGEEFVAVSKFPTVALFCDACRRKRSPFGRQDGFGQKHEGFKGPGRKKA